MSFKKLRKRAGLRQAEAAARLEVTQSAVSQWESGSCRPRAGVLQKMALLYRCTADELLTAQTGRAGGERRLKQAQTGTETEEIR